MYLGTSTKVLNKICQVAASALKTNIACVLSANEIGSRRIKGSSGCLLSSLKGSLAIPGLALEERDTVYLPAVTKQKWFPHHPLSRLAPAAKSLFAASLGDGSHYLTIFNPDDAILKRPETISLLSDLLSLVELQLDTGQERETAYSTPTGALKSDEGNEVGFGESSRVVPEPDEMIRFLDKTLVRGPKLAIRNGVAYLTARCWRKSTKDVQLAAMFAIKRHSSELALGVITEDIIAIALELNGPAAYDAVVPVPCGNSGTERCLSAKIADALAKRLGLPVAHCLKGKLGKGSSHPRRNASLERFHLVEPVPRRILLVDDVVTSGLHIEYSVTSLREAGAVVTAIAWIGPSRSGKDSM